jgi:LacI family transcriptional regulator
MSEESLKPAGIRQIAKALNISIGTVDRALHERPGVSPKTRDRVLTMARKLNYTPNVVARNLRLNRHLRVGVFLPEQIASFFDPLRDGIRNAAEHWSGSSIDIDFHTYPRLGEGEVKAMKAADWQSYDGIIMAPGDPSAMSAVPRRADLETPIVYVATDAPRTVHLCSITIDAFVSGGIAAELLGSILSRPAPVITFTGDLRVQDHSDKLRGFAGSLAMLAPHLSLLPAVETHELPQDAYKSALQVLKKRLDIGGIYINTANSLPVLRAAEESGVLGKVKIITTDFFPELVPRIESGHVFASLYQRPFVQGRTAFETLCRYLSFGTAPERQVNRLAPHIILRSNLSLFTTSTRGPKAGSPVGRHQP